MKLQRHIVEVGGEHDKAVTEEVGHTAGKPYQIVLDADRKTITSNGEDISFVTISVVDKNGIPCTTATNQFKVSGAATYRAACNGNATSLETFHKDTMKLFSGKLAVLAKSTTTASDVKLEVNGAGLKSGKLNLRATK